MRKSLIYLLLGIVAVGICVLVALPGAFREPFEPTERVRAADQKDDPPDEVAREAAYRHLLQRRLGIQS